MDQADVYFTSTIVGSPVTLVLGTPVSGPTATMGAMTIDLRASQPRFAENWRDWVLLSPQAPAGQAWRRPGRLRGWLVRHSLWLMVAGWGLAAVLLAQRLAPEAMQRVLPGLAPWFDAHAGPWIDELLYSLGHSDLWATVRSWFGASH